MTNETVTKQYIGIYLEIIHEAIISNFKPVFKSMETLNRQNIFFYLPILASPRLHLGKSMVNIENTYISVIVK